MRKPGVYLKRVYEPAAPADGVRVLVDALWPRGVGKAKARLHEWSKDVAPSKELRQWFGHDPARWDEFRRRYRAELADKPETLEHLRSLARERPVTLLFSARDTEHNNAVVLKEVLEEGL